MLIFKLQIYDSDLHNNDFKFEKLYDKLVRMASVLGATLV